MPQLRTVRCEVTLTGTPEWVAQTLSRSAVLPDKGKSLVGLGKIGSVILSDRTNEIDREDLQIAVGLPPHDASQDEGPYPDTRRSQR